MTIRSSLALTLTTAFLALGLGGCAAAYPDSTAGRACRHSREVCGDTSLTVQQCVDAWRVVYDLSPACRAQIDTYNECLARNGTAGCGTFIMVCQAELTAQQECQNSGMGGGV